MNNEKINNREIKFRTWDIENKEMIYFTLEEPKIIEELPLEENRIDMEYIGIIDVNGNEIYEGDIVLCKSFYHDSTWLMTIHDIRYIERLAKDEMDRKVLGNIFQNKEILDEDMSKYRF